MEAQRRKRSLSVIVPWLLLQLFHNFSSNPFENKILMQTRKKSSSAEYLNEMRKYRQ